MCPEPSILSAYFDGELSRKRYARLHAHLQDCPTCRGTLKSLMKLREILRGAEAPDFESGAEDFRQYALRRRYPRVADRGSISVPIPVAVAASIVFVAVLGLNLLPRPSANAIPQLADAAEAEMDSNLISVSVSTNELEGILAIMEKEVNPNGQLVAGLPVLFEGMNLTRNGEPQFLRPASYGGDP